jgi:hypothetical protein
VPKEPTDVALQEKLVGYIGGAFWVPAYQRGYRWGVQDVERLLDDLLESNGDAYYLQPIVVKAMDDGRWELIDGQQRLTTLFLVLAYMLQSGLQNDPINYSLDYETRPEMARYLARPHEIPAEENIDAFHLAGAYSTIVSWFEGQAPRRQHIANKLYGYFFESVKVIWYEAPATVDSATVFTRLNVGRIPLTDAELVKALLLSRADTAAPSHGRPYEIANQWDAIEKSLRDPELWAFLTAGKRDDSTHISLLLDVLAEGPLGRERPLFFTFETLRARIDASPLDVWNQVLDLHSTIIGWYEDRDVFHRVGFLINTGDDLSSVLALAHDLGKAEFDAALVGRIADRLALSAQGVKELSYEPRNVRKTEVALFLMNVETVRRHRSSSERYSFDEHARGRWSLEHIHAQNAETLTRQEQWWEWLRLHRDAIDGVPSIDSDERAEIDELVGNALNSSRLTAETFRSLEAMVRNLLSGGAEVDVHSISNLALLDAGTNSALSNGVFEVKRREVLDRDREGRFIPPCTRNVFLKYYTRAAGQQLHFWGPADREGYLDAIIETLQPYLAPDEHDENPTGGGEDD